MDFFRHRFRSLLVSILISGVGLFPFTHLEAQELPLETSASYSRSPVELNRQIVDDMAWLGEADHLMVELEILDVRMHTLVGRAVNDDIRGKLIRERNNVRRLIVDLTFARNTVYSRLEDNQKERETLDMALPGMKDSRRH